MVELLSTLNAQQGGRKLLGEEEGWKLSSGLVVQPSMPLQLWCSGTWPSHTWVLGTSFSLSVWFCSLGLQSGAVRNCQVWQGNGKWSYLQKWRSWFISHRSLICFLEIQRRRERHRYKLSLFHLEEHTASGPPVSAGGTIGCAAGMFLQWPVHPTKTSSQVVLDNKLERIGGKWDFCCLWASYGTVWHAVIYHMCVYCILY